MTISHSFRLKGQDITLTDDQVLEAARSALVRGVPREAQRFDRWAVSVDGTQVGLRWLFILVTGVSEGVTSDNARGHFQKLRLPIVDRDTTGKPSVTSTGSGGQWSLEDRWATIAANEVAHIRAYLGGQRTTAPSSEQLCDWVQFCYTFELYAEGRDLFLLVSPQGVNEWHFERTRKLARICGMKAAEQT